MMISIIINKVKNLSKAWLRSNNSIEVFRPPPAWKIVFHDDFNHPYFQQATPVTYFQMQRASRGSMMISIIIFPIGNSGYILPNAESQQRKRMEQKKNGGFVVVFCLQRNKTKRS
ncbi:hypothetical protein Pyn_29195 [Prunus yedoensis var. nudiflora]|uniref:Uncharacterized protein n=1 Tax=Prunus yedoensis var. nudiflora TaxID=2094558 RepID=A0A314UAK6_PRUYE|nr:hypothetical protein Pyn_29195 [Prunus yedoensis var. nudiflora]